MKSAGWIVAHFILFSAFITYAVVPAFAHKLYLFVTIEALASQPKHSRDNGERFQLVGQVYYSARSPLVDAEIKILSLDNKLIDVVRSDKEGRFYWPLTTAFSFKVQSRSMDGHLVERVIVPPLPDRKTTALKLRQNQHKHKQSDKKYSRNNKVALAIAPLQNQLQAEEVRHILSSELTPLKEQISKLHHKIWLLEILGGLGILFGGFGIWMFTLSKKTPPHKGDI